MPTSILQIIGGFSVAMATTAAIPKAPTNESPPAASQNVIGSSAAATSGPGLPADFPIPRGLSPCKPLVASGEIICEWRGVDGTATYKFYLEALPKAGYTLLPGALKAVPPDYHGYLALGFKKGSAKGAVTIASGDLTIQYLPRE